MPRPNPISSPHRMRAKRLGCNCEPRKDHAPAPHGERCGCLCHYPKKFDAAISKDRKARCGRTHT